MKEYVIHLDKPRTIRFTRNSLVLAGNILNSSPEDIISHVMTPPPDLDKAFILLWTALLEDDPKITLWDVKQLVKAAIGNGFPTPRRMGLARFPFLCNAALKEYRKESEEVDC